MEYNILDGLAAAFLLALAMQNYFFARKGCEEKSMKQTSIFSFVSTFCFVSAFVFLTKIAKQIWLG